MKMENNRYSPPTTSVADPAAAPRKIPRPPTVTVAAVILWITCVIELARPLPRFFSGAGSASLARMLAVPLVLSGLLALFTYYLFKGRRWARLAVLLYFVFLVLTAGLVEYAMTLTVPEGVRAVRDIRATVIAYSPFALQAVAVGMLFARSSSAWFSDSRLAGEQPAR